MKRTILTLALSATLALSTLFVVSPASANGCGVSEGGPFDGGDGLSATPFLVSTAAQLQSIETNACLVNSYHFKQTADISLAGLTWTPLGTAFEFNGTYDGDFHTVSDLLITSSDAVVAAGLFGSITAATIKNLEIKDSSVIGSAYTGVLAGVTQTSSTITRVAITNGSATSSGYVAGGLTGLTYGSRSFITEVSIEATVSAAANAGGVVGQVEYLSATISDAAFSGSVTATGQMSGGIVGYGIAPTISNSYSVGTITGGTVFRGGVLAFDGNGAGSVTDSFFLDTGVTQLSSNYATAKTATELKTLATYPAVSPANWSITSDLSAVIAKTATETWLLNPGANDGYPLLVWMVDAGFYPIVAETVSRKVNALSFKGYVALYALGYEGQRLSAKVGKDWVVIPTIPKATNNLYRFLEVTGTGYQISVRIYIDRVLTKTIPLKTK